MRKYLTYFIVSFRANTAFKVDVSISIIFEMVYFYIYFSLWQTIYSVSNVSTISSYSISAMVTYYFVTAFLYQTDPTRAIYLGNEIWNGNFTNDLIKPWRVKFIHYIYTAGDVGFRLFMYLPFFFFIYLTVHNYIIIPTPLNLLFFVFTVFLTFIMMMSFYLIFHTLTFFLGDQYANIGLIAYLVTFLGGGVIPLSLLPDAVKPYIEYLPFRFAFNEPANIFLGKVTTTEVFWGWFQIILWSILFYLIYSIIFQKGTKRYTGTGR